MSKRAIFTIWTGACCKALCIPILCMFAPIVMTIGTNFRIEFIVRRLSSSLPITSNFYHSTRSHNHLWSAKSVHTPKTMKGMHAICLFALLPLLPSCFCCSLLYTSRLSTDFYDDEILSPVSPDHISAGRVPSFLEPSSCFPAPKPPCSTASSATPNTRHPASASQAIATAPKPWSWIGLHARTLHAVRPRAYSTTNLF